MDFLHFKQEILRRECIYLYILTNIWTSKYNKQKSTQMSKTDLKSGCETGSII